MSGYNPYADIGHQPNGAPMDPQQDQRRPPIAPGPTGYQQGSSYGQNPQNAPYGVSPQPSPALAGQQQYPNFPPHQDITASSEDPGSTTGLTSQMGAMGLGQEGAPGRLQKKKNRHAYHNLDQKTVSTQAFNQSVGGAPQFLSQEEPRQQPAAQNYSPGMNNFASQPDAGSFSPGLQQSKSPGFGQGPHGPPASAGQQVSAQGQVDPEQIPSVPRARDGAAKYFSQHVYPTMEQHLPPPGAIPFVTHDQGNSSPKFARLTVNNIPSSSDALSATGLPLGLVLQPLAPLQAGEQTVPVLDFGDVGPPRCRRCRAYINPFMIFRSGGNKLVCNMCTFPNDVTPEYYAPTDPSGVRVDRNQRPELTTGTVEYLVPKEYWAKEPVGLRWLFVIDVSQEANDKGFLKTFCEGILEALYGDDLKNDDNDEENDNSDEKKDQNDTQQARALPPESKVGFITFDKVAQFYNCSVSWSLRFACIC